MFNLTVSNVVLSKDPLYLGRAQLELIAPVSFLCDGYGLNITLVGYTDKVILGFVGCRDTIPHLQRLAIYARDALDGLEQAATWLFWWALSPHCEVPFSPTPTPTPTRTVTA